MKKLSNNLAMYLLCFSMFVAVFCAMSLQAEAANTQTGTFGERDSIVWNYDANTKTLTLQGDGKLETVNWDTDDSIQEICPDVKTIYVKNCKVSDCNSMFEGLNYVQSINFENFDTSQVTNMEYMFWCCQNLSSLDLSDFDTSQVTNMRYMLDSCYKLSSVDVSTWDTASVTNMRAMFGYCGSLSSVDVSAWDTSSVTDMSDMFFYCCNLSSVDVSAWDTASVTNMRAMFGYCSSLSSVDVSTWDTSQVTDMRYMFEVCESLSSVDVSTWDTASVTDMGGMFLGCRKLSSLNLSNFDTAKVTYMDEMFFNCSSLSGLNLSNFDTAKVSTMSKMFSGCSSLGSLDVSSFDTSQVTYMGDMFYKCSSLSSLNLSNFDTAKVIDMPFMFSGCSSLNSLDVSSFDTSNVTNMIFMFSYCTNLSSLNLSNFDTAKVMMMLGMFGNCERLKSLDVSNFIISQGTVLSSVFAGCNALEVLYTFKDMNEEAKVELPGTFVDLNQKQTTSLTQEFCNTTLVNVNNLVTGVSVSPASAELKPGDAKQLKATVAPEKAAIKDVTWKSSDTEVATVDTNGKVTAVAPGSATITVTAMDGSGKSASCTVAVTQPINGITLNKTSLSLKVGGSATLTATVAPSNASNKGLTWKSSDTSIATVDTSGKVIAVAPGIATITVTAKDGSGKSTSCTVTVKKENPFADVEETDWEYPFVEFVYDHNIMAGKGKTAEGKIIFDPDKYMTRAEFVQVLYNASGKPAVNIENQFPDVKNAWYKNAVLWANANDIANGKGNGEFGVTESISRQDLALMLYKYARMNGYDLTANTGEINKYADGNKVSNYAKTAMDWAITKGIMSGKGTKGEDISTFKLDPTGTATRAECAAMLKNFMEAYGK